MMSQPQYRIKIVSDELISGVTWYKVSFTDSNFLNTSFFTTRYRQLRAVHENVLNTYQG